jgi:outer membrane receptor protein involved in Fe transport
MKTKTFWTVIPIITFASAPFSPMHGQAAPSPSVVASAASNSAPVTMSAFIVDVSRDRGYVAVDSLAGGRTNTPIRFTPSAMSSLTRTFIDDLAVTNVRDALQWTLNVVPSDWYAGKSSSNPFNAWDYNFRGAGQSLQGGAGPMRNYFTFYQVADSYNIERIEADRGPNSILFGVGTVGGVLSVYTKIPRLEKNATSGTAQFDQFGSYRFELDANVRVAPTVALRLNAVDDHRRGWRNGDRNHFQALDLAALYKPLQSTSVRVELEGGRAKNTLISTTFPEAVSAWDATTSSPTWGSTVTARGVEPMRQWGPAKYNVWVAGQPTIGLQDWFQGYRSGGVFLPIAPRAGWYTSGMVNGTQTLDGAKLPVLPSRDFTFGSGTSEPSYENITAYVDHSFNESFDAEIAGYRYTDTHLARNYEGLSYFAYDLNRQLPNGSANPNFGQPYGDFFLSQQRQNRTVTEYRVQLNYHFTAKPFGVPLAQRFSLAAGDQKITWRARQRMAQVTNSSSTRAEDRMVWGRLYLNHANTEIDLPSSFNGLNVEYAPWPTYWFDFDETYKLKNVSLMSQSLLWDDRLSVILGARNDDYSHHRVNAVTGVPTDDGASGTTYSAGAIYYFIRTVGAFVNFSKNFDPIGPGKSPGLNGQPFGPATGKGYEYGLRLSTNDGKYYATLNRYDTQSSGRITGTKIDLAGIWKQYYLATGQPADTTRTQLSYDDTEALDVTGYELEVTANPTRALRLQAGYAKPDSKIVDAMAGQRGYYAANLNTWTTAAAASTPDATTLRNLLTNAQTTLNNNVAGATKTGLVKYTLNAFANYTFLEGALRGFSIGGGFAQTGRQYVSTIANVKRYSSQRRTANAVLAFETRFREHDVRFALNVDNVFDKRDPIVTSYDGGWKDPAGNPISNGYYFQSPRTFRLTARVGF